MAGFIFDQAMPKASNHCAGRTSLEHIQLRARLILFPAKTGFQIARQGARLYRSGATRPAPKRNSRLGWGLMPLGTNHIKEGILQIEQDGLC